MREQVALGEHQRVRDRVAGALTPRPPPSLVLLGLLGGVAGERDEHVVERRAAHGDVRRCPTPAASSRRTASAIAPAPRSQRHATMPCSHFGALVGERRRARRSRRLLVVGPRASPRAARRRTRPFSSSERALGDHAAVVDHRDAVGEPVGLVEVLRGEQHGGARRPRAPRSSPRAGAGCAGRARWWARRGTAPAGARPARRRGRGGGACRRSRSSRGGRRPRSASKRSSSSPARSRDGRAAEVVEPPDHLEVLEARSGSRRPPRTGRRGRSASAARRRPRTTSRPATRAVPPSGGSSVVRMRTAVVLPAPFGPEQAEHGARRGAQVDAAERLARRRTTCGAPSTSIAASAASGHCTHRR